MAPAVANDKLLGYRALYRTLLEDSKRGMAMAIRPFVDSDNYPILVHCIHGKDRTGLIIMLLLMLCNVDTEVKAQTLICNGLQGVAHLRKYSISHPVIPNP